MHAAAEGLQRSGKNRTQSKNQTATTETRRYGENKASKSELSSQDSEVKCTDDPMH